MTRRPKGYPRNLWWRWDRAARREFLRLFDDARLLDPLPATEPQSDSDTAYGGCAEYRATGGFHCWGSDTYRTCEPTKERVRYSDGTQP